MLGIGRRRRAREEAARQAWMAAWQDVLDPALHQRVIDATDRAIGAALPRNLDIDVTDGITHTSAWLTCLQVEIASAQKTVHPDGADYQIFIEQDDPDAGPWVLVSTRPDWGHGSKVRWMPGQGFETVEQLLDWFEQI